MQPNSNKSVYILLILILVGVAGILVMSFARSGSLMAGSAVNGSDSFFDTLNGSITGQVTKVNGNTLTIKNKNGLSRDFKSAPSLFIMNQMQAGAIATPSSDLNKLEIGKKVMINVSMMGNDLQVTSITPSIDIGTPGAPLTTNPAAVLPPPKTINQAPEATGASNQKLPAAANPQTPVPPKP